MIEIERLDPCPTCGHRRWKDRVCTCDHAMALHNIGKRKGELVRTDCSHMGPAGQCECAQFTEVTSCSFIGQDAHKKREELVRTVDCPVCLTEAPRQCFEWGEDGRRVLMIFSHWGRYRIAAEQGLVPPSFCTCHGTSFESGSVCAYLVPTGGER